MGTATVSDRLFNPDAVVWKVEDWATGAKHEVEQSSPRCPWMAILSVYPEAEAGTRRHFMRTWPQQNLWMICDPSTGDKFPRWAATVEETP